MAVSAHHYEVRRNIRRARQNCVWDIHISNGDFLKLDIEAMTGEMICDISTGNFGAFEVCPNGHHFDRFCACKKRLRIGDGAGGVAASVPTDQHMFETETLRLDVGHNQYRST